MKYRNVRIAWSVAWGLFAVLLCVLWVRISWFAPICFRRFSDGVQTIAAAANGFIVYSRWDFGSEIGKRTGWVEYGWKRSGGYPRFDNGRPKIEWRKYQLEIETPIWSPLPLLAVLGIAPWIHWSRRFSLRTLLIATTLAAVLLCCVVRLSR
jgi:hypothetical protein